MHDVGHSTAGTEAWSCTVVHAPSSVVLERGLVLLLSTVCGVLCRHSSELGVAIE